ncbi:GIY-YIG catalytic domain protein [Methanobrevibacter cuticularis]|uniref:GIY-YIG catalytic domain protein n=1 Tax=Methanobrevibacter cuticularis TaxID=47311 RepID=A0A166EJK9_9EURY|nr:GIY-YIG nuclease family protein [Methanobrevibacter cuticularis]KZX16726.1 GIY-YIG catalytic domain protein [Methanobrevibacter cuticularis]
MTYIYAHFFSNGDKYVGISNHPEERWKEGFDSNNSRQYNHKVLIANEKYDRLSLVISENLPRRIAETMEAILINGFDDFNLNIKDEIIPNLHGNDVVCIYTENFSHVYPKIDGEILYHSPEIEENNNYQLYVGKVLTRIEIEEIKKEKEKIVKEEIKEEYDKIKDEISEKEFWEKYNEKKKEYGDINFLNGVDMARSIVSEYIIEIARRKRKEEERREERRLCKLAQQNGVSVHEIKRLEKIEKERERKMKYMGNGKGGVNLGKILENNKKGHRIEENYGNGKGGVNLGKILENNKKGHRWG